MFRPAAHVEFSRDTFGSEHSAQCGSRRSGLGLIQTPASAPNKWLGFNPAWDDKVLRGFGIPYVHMTEFTKCEGAFAFLKGEQEKQSAILDCAAKTTKAWTNKTFTVAVDLAGFRRADRMYRVSEGGTGREMQRPVMHAAPG